ncbi:hypothetical protein M0R45_036126 [Rubus argutus]|uniref:Uncharacterized protein n=1 Tax=Rubus argutus TaxID=59490 RepID=A0AAW1VWP0_RUBAR
MDCRCGAAWVFQRWQGLKAAEQIGGLGIPGWAVCGHGWAAWFWAVGDGMRMEIRAGLGVGREVRHGWAHGDLQQLGSRRTGHHDGVDGVI